MATASGGGQITTHRWLTEFPKSKNRNHEHRRKFNISRFYDKRLRPDRKTQSKTKGPKTGDNLQTVFFVLKATRCATFINPHRYIVQ
jgi:hypothetical protein